jgi:hypothetical protein
MAKRNEFAGFFGGTDSRDSRDTENVALCDLVAFDGAQRSGLQNKFARRDGFAQNDWFCGNVDHAGLAARIDMGQFRHCPILFFHVALSVKRSHSSYMELVTVFSTFNPAEAELIRSQLEIAGFDVEPKNNETAWAWGAGITAGAVELQVPADQAADAKALLQTEVNSAEQTP